MKLLLTTALLTILASVSHAQEPPKVCISQNAANVCAANSRELTAIREKVLILEQSLKDKDTSIEELKTLNRTNVADITNALHETEIRLATATGQIIQLEADRVRWTAVVDVLIKNSRKKSIGLIAF